MVLLLIVSGAVSVAACALLIRRSRHWARAYGKDMPQRFHAGQVPRVGGLGMLLGCLAGWTLMAAGAPLPVPGPALVAWAGLALATGVAVGAGLADDITQALRPRWRLGASLLAGWLAIELLGLRIVRLDVPVLDAVLVALPLATAGFALLAIAGLPHAFNLIDGYNGLAGTVALMCCAAIAHVALQVGDPQLAGIVAVLAGATAGFLVWNYPRGMIFAGDGGAYLWGVVIAIATIALVQRHPQVSPWFPALLLVYPVWETLFSAYRKLVRGQSPGLADALHLHQLVYRRLVRGVVHPDESRRMLMRNNRTSPYLWGLAALSVVPAVLFWRSTPLLMAFCALFAVTYVGCYLCLVRFKVPPWLRPRRRRPPPVRVASADLQRSE